MNNKTLLIDNQYFPCVDYIKMLSIYKHAKIEQYDSWQKMSFRNRCVVAGSNGLIHLSVPVEGGRNQKGYYKDVKIAGSEWAKQHWKTIVSCYRKAPFFEYFAADIENLLVSPSSFLYDLNTSITNRLVGLFKIKCEIEFTKDFIRTYDNPEIEDKRNYWLPKNYDRVENNELNNYYQLFSEQIGYQRNISILDYLFCEGNKF